MDRSKMSYETRKEWRVRNNLDDGTIEKFTGWSTEWEVKSIKDILLLLSYNWEFYVKFRGEEYFLTTVYFYSITYGPTDETLYETDDLDDFGENARIGENGEFYLKDVIDELEF